MNYRPKHLPLGIGKVLDSLVCNHLTEFLNIYNITPVQHGFVRKYSTLDKSEVLVSNIANTLGRGQNYDSLLLDLSKTFDKVPHPVVLPTLAKNSVRTVQLSGYLITCQTANFKSGSDGLSTASSPPPPPTTTHTTSVLSASKLSPWLDFKSCFTSIVCLIQSITQLPAPP